MSGVLRIRKELDFEKQQFFNLTVLADDRGVPSLRSETFVEVEVGNTKTQMHTCAHTHTIPMGTLIDTHDLNSIVT